MRLNTVLLFNATIFESTSILASLICIFKILTQAWIVTMNHTSIWGRGFKYHSRSYFFVNYMSYLFSLEKTLMVMFLYFPEYVFVSKIIGNIAECDEGLKVRTWFEWNQFFLSFVFDRTKSFWRLRDHFEFYLSVFFQIKQL